MADLTITRADFLEAMHAAHTALNHASLPNGDLSKALVQLDKAVVIAAEVRKQIVAAQKGPSPAK